MKNKKVRQFNERQNEVLDDWVEVDTLVLSLVEDVMGSMNPDAGMYTPDFENLE